MKFAKRLEAEAVPEWRPKYLRYKQLKKLINKVSTAHTPEGIASRAPLLPSADLEKGGGNGSDKFSDSEQLFVSELQLEAAKIEEFYKAREKEAVDKKFLIMAQLHILPERKCKRSKRGGEVSPTQGQENPGSVFTWRSLPSSELSHGGDISAGSGDESPLGTPTQLSVKASPTTTAAAKGELPEHLKISSLRHASFTHLARLRIKKALLELYRSLELLRSYKTLNMLAFAKILKKFDKHTGRHLTPKFTETLSGHRFYTSQVIDSLMTDVENIYCWVFTEGDRAKALRKLRVKDFKKDTFYASSFISGMLLCFSAVLAWRLFKLCWGTSDVQTKCLGLMYYGFGLPFAMAWLFAINAKVWESYYVNYRFIMEFNQRNNLHIQQYSLLVGIFTVLYLVLVTISMQGWLNFILTPLLQPWLVLFLILVLLLCPFALFYRSSRFWFARVLMRIFTAPFYPCRFKDFFINDQYMSLTLSFRILGMLIFYTLASRNFTPTRAEIPQAWYIYGLEMLPGLWRSLQCLRRYHDSKMAFPHLANLAKYMCSLAVPFLVGVEKLYAVDSVGYVVIVARLVSSTFSLIWDYVMDFGLWQRSALNDGLRSAIIFKPWIYWCLMATNFFARYVWVLTILQPRLFPSLSPLVLLLALATIEMLRRFQWNFFRVEYEHINNCNCLRAVADVPLPFTAGDLFYQDMVETIQQQQHQQGSSSTPSDQASSPSTDKAPPSPSNSLVMDDLDEEEYAYARRSDTPLKPTNNLDTLMCEREPDQEKEQRHRQELEVKAAFSGWSSPSTTRPPISKLFTPDDNHDDNNNNHRRT